MLTEMTDAEWEIVVEAFRAARSRRGGRGRDDRKFLEALHYFTVHNITWRALPREFGKWNSIWKRFWRRSQRGVFEAMLALLAETSSTAPPCCMDRECGRTGPTRVPGYAMRTYSGRPRSSIRFSTSAAIATSLA